MAFLVIQAIIMVADISMDVLIRWTTAMLLDFKKMRVKSSHWEALKKLAFNAAKS